MNSKLRAALIALTVVCAFVALYYPVSQYLEGRALDDEMASLRRMKDLAADEAAESSQVSGPDAARTDQGSNGASLDLPQAAPGSDQAEEAADQTDPGREDSPADNGETNQSIPSAFPSGNAVTAGPAQPDARGETGDADPFSSKNAKETAPAPSTAGAGLYETASEPTDAGRTPPAGAVSGANSSDQDATPPSSGGESALTLSAAEAPESAAGLAQPNEPAEPGVDQALQAGASEAPEGTADRAAVSAPGPTPAPFVFDADKILPEYKPLYEENQDLVGWLKIEGTVIDYPVVKRADEQYYLTRDFYGRDNKNGQLILDAQCDAFLPSLNLVISGHNMKSGKMFGSLQNYASQSFGRRHDLIEFDTLFRKGQYRLVAAFYAWDYQKREDGFRYNVDIKYRLELLEFLKKLEEIKLYDTGVSVEFGDELIMLSTCSNETEDGRFVVVARRLREGEAP